MPYAQSGPMIAMRAGGNVTGRQHCCGTVNCNGETDARDPVRRVRVSLRQAKDLVRQHAAPFRGDERPLESAMAPVPRDHHGIAG